MQSIKILSLLILCGRILPCYSQLETFSQQNLLDIAHPLGVLSLTNDWPIRPPWTEEPGRLQSMDSHKVRHYWATKHSTALWTTYKFFPRDGAHTRNLIWVLECQMGSGLGVCQICSPGKSSAVFPPIQSPFPIFQFQAKFYPLCKWPWSLRNHPGIIFSFPFLIKLLQLMATALPQTSIKFSLFRCHERILSPLLLSPFPGQSFWNTLWLW